MTSEGTVVALGTNNNYGSDIAKNNDSSNYIIDGNLKYIEHVKNVSFHDFTTNLNKNYSYKQKINIIEMLWFVVLVDKIEHDFESNLMRRICGLLYIRDVDSGKIRKKVREKLNI